MSTNRETIPTSDCAGGQTLRRRRPRASTYSARLVGTVNQSPLEVIGQGTINQTTGRVHGCYALKRLSDGLHPRLLNAVMVTGYPSVCQESSDTPNPFAAGSYSYSRSLDFGDRGRISYTANCQDVDRDGTASWLDSDFEISGSVELPVLVATAPLIETWTPISGRRIDGCFTMVWRTEAGDRINAVARTEYLIPECAILPSQVLYRCIELRNSQEAAMLEIDQRSRLLSEHAVGRIAFSHEE